MMLSIELEHIFDYVSWSEMLSCKKLSILELHVCAVCGVVGRKRKMKLEKKNPHVSGLEQF